MIKTPSDDRPTAISMAIVAGSTGDNDPYLMDQSSRAAVGSGSEEPHYWVVAVPTQTFVAMHAPEISYWDAFCDLWLSPDEIVPTPLDFGYGARLGDALRIRGDFDKAIAGLGLRQGNAGE